MARGRVGVAEEVIEEERRELGLRSNGEVLGTSFGFLRDWLE